MDNESKAAILKNIKRLENKLVGSMDEKDLKTAYNYAARIKNGILQFQQDKTFGIPQSVSAAAITECAGHIYDGMAILFVGEALPHTKTELTGALISHWQSCIHAAIEDLAAKDEVPKFDKAMVGIYAAMPHGANNSRIWDSSNRAINLIINNLKGIFFSDDNIKHMAFAVVGGWSDSPMTKVVIGDFYTGIYDVLQQIKT